MASHAAAQVGQPAPSTPPSTARPLLESPAKRRRLRSAALRRCLWQRTRWQWLQERDSAEESEPRGVASSLADKLGEGKEEEVSSEPQSGPRDAAEQEPAQKKVRFEKRAEFDLSATTHSRLAVGDRVVFQGLRAADLNGQLGTVLSFVDVPGGRVPVLLDESGKKVAIKPANLKHVEPQMKPDCQEQWFTKEEVEVLLRDVVQRATREARTGLEAEIRRSLEEKLKQQMQEFEWLRKQWEEERQREEYELEAMRNELEEAEEIEERRQVQWHWMDALGASNSCCCCEEPIEEARPCEGCGVLAHVACAAKEDEHGSAWRGGGWWCSHCRGTSFTSSSCSSGSSAGDDDDDDEGPLTPAGLGRAAQQCGVDLPGSTSSAP
mmetsp:Transcript_61076/g.189683  ORF Transcript_61076/g.189683 Transcript_61076/m.189683 type:complete len:380 (+) Transcript_61076:76-1215(+)